MRGSSRIQNWVSPVTKLPFGTSPVIRELPITHCGKIVIAEMHPTQMVYRVHGKRIPIATISHAEIIAVARSGGRAKVEPDAA